MLTTIFRAFVDVVAQYFAVFYAPVFVFWLIIHLNIEYWRGKAKKAYWIACLAWPAITGPLLIYREEVFAIRWRTPAWMIAMGSLAFVVAVRFLWRAFRVIPFRTLVGLPELEPSRNVQPLIDHGVYSQTRNPIYFMHSAFILAWAMLTGFAANWALLALDLLLMPLTILAEERELIRRYGDAYRVYKRRVPRFIPRWPW
jgi:protein-S-isoprenylcysteine O-methyltransferase Ste14